MRQVEHVAISRDTTESDLKQRREFIGGSVGYVDQPVVQARYTLAEEYEQVTERPVSQAALHGRVLVLEGIEKAERNLLPVLNNLLENREMALEACSQCRSRRYLGDISAII